MNIKDLDLNLLRLFDAVWRTRSVSLAAQQLGMSQPAASQGLARLRAVLGDALFERSDNYYAYVKPWNVDDQRILQKMKFPGKPPVWIPMPPH